MQHLKDNWIDSCSESIALRRKLRKEVLLEIKRNFCDLTPKSFVWMLFVSQFNKQYLRDTCWKIWLWTRYETIPNNYWSFFRCENGIIMSILLTCTVMCRLVMCHVLGIYSEKCVFRWFHGWANITECT